MAQAENCTEQTLCGKSVLLRRVNLVTSACKEERLVPKGNTLSDRGNLWSVLDAKSH